MKWKWYVFCGIVLVHFLLGLTPLPPDAKQGISGWGMKAQIRQDVRENVNYESVIPQRCFDKNIVCIYHSDNSVMYTSNRVR